MKKLIMTAMMLAMVPMSASAMLIASPAVVTKWTGTAEVPDLRKGQSLRLEIPDYASYPGDKFNFVVERGGEEIYRKDNVGQVLIIPHDEVTRIFRMNTGEQEVYLERDNGSKVGKGRNPKKFDMFKVNRGNTWEEWVQNNGMALPDDWGNLQIKLGFNETLDYEVGALPSSNYPSSTISSMELELFSGSEFSNLGSFSSLNEVYGNLVIEPDLDLSLEGLHNIRVIGGDAKLKVTGMSGNNSMTALEEVVGLLEFTGSGRLNNGISFPSLTRVGALSMQYVEIPNMSIMPNLSQITGGLRVVSSNVDNFVGLESITEIQEIYLSSSGLKSWAGLNNLTTVTGSLNASGFTNNWREKHSFTDMQGLNGLVSVGQNLSLDRNKLSTLDGLESLTSVGGWVYLYGNKLVNLNGLSGLESVGRDLKLHSNNLLVDISGLRNITSLGGRLFLQTGIQNRAGFVGIPSSSWLCQPAQSGKFPGWLAQQADVCV